MKKKSILLVLIGMVVGSAVGATTSWAASKTKSRWGGPPAGKWICVEEDDLPHIRRDPDAVKAAEGLNKMAPSAPVGATLVMPRDDGDGIVCAKN